MQDKAQEISAWCWRWYKLASNMDKGELEWKKLIEQAIETEKKYDGDVLNKKLFEDMFLAFEAHVERLEKGGV